MMMEREQNIEGRGGDQHGCAVFNHETAEHGRVRRTAATRRGHRSHPDGARERYVSEGETEAMVWSGERLGPVFL